MHSKSPSLAMFEDKKSTKHLTNFNDISHHLVVIVWRSEYSQCIIHKISLSTGKFMKRLSDPLIP